MIDVKKFPTEHRDAMIIVAASREGFGLNYRAIGNLFLDLLHDVEDGDTSEFVERLEMLEVQLEVMTGGNSRVQYNANSGITMSSS